jgi:hypothetical protein
LILRKDLEAERTKLENLQALACRALGSASMSEVDDTEKLPSEVAGMQPRRHASQADTDNAKELQTQTQIGRANLQTSPPASEGRRDDTKDFSTLTQTQIQTTLSLPINSNTTITLAIAINNATNAHTIAKRIGQWVTMLEHLRTIQSLLGPEGRHAESLCERLEDVKCELRHSIFRGVLLVLHIRRHYSGMRFGQDVGHLEEGQGIGIDTDVDTSKADANADLEEDSRAGTEDQNGYDSGSGIGTSTSFLRDLVAGLFAAGFSERVTGSLVDATKQ